MTFCLSCDKLIFTLTNDISYPLIFYVGANEFHESTHIPLYQIAEIHFAAGNLKSPYRQIIEFRFVMSFIRTSK